jgi:hypothetical protein
MRIDLKVPYEEKDHAKRLGARWDVARRTWYVENVENIAKFMKWMPRQLTRAHGKPFKKKKTAIAADRVNASAFAHLREIARGDDV